MGNKLMDLRDTRFVLYEQLNVEELVQGDPVSGSLQRDF